MAARQRQTSTSKALMRQVRQYLDSISRTVDVTELQPTGEVDKKGNPICEKKPVYNDRGEIIRTREYVIQDCTDCASPGKCRVCGGSGKA